MNTMKLYNDYANNNDPKSNIGGSKQAIHQLWLREHYIIQTFHWLTQVIMI